MGQAHEAHEMAEQIKHVDQNQIKGAILVSVLAMALAIVSLGGNNAAKEATQENILAANAYNFYQAKMSAKPPINWRLTKSRRIY